MFTLRTRAARPGGLPTALLAAMLLAGGCGAIGQDWPSTGAAGAADAATPDAGGGPRDVVSPPRDVPKPAKDLGAWPDLGQPPDPVDVADPWWERPDVTAPADADDGPPPGPITVAEGERVIPQTVLHLSPDPDFVPPERAARFHWRVEQPEGSQSVFVPSPVVAAPTFEANVAGVYTFFLDVWDAAGEPVTEGAVYRVEVVPEDAIHVELLWTTPGDPDETDTGPFAGSDMDLHFLHPNAPRNADAPDLDGDGTPDPYNDQPWDCYWFNPHPDWATPSSQGIDDDPGLDRDDTDGAGPENINLNLAEDGAVYRVAVHYWNDHAYGESFATVRVYIHGELVYEVPEFRLINYDLWCVAHIAWPSGVVEPCVGPDGGVWVTPNYRHPMFWN